MNRLVEKLNNTVYAADNFREVRKSQSMSKVSPEQTQGPVEGGRDLKSAATIKALFSRYAAEPADSGYRQWQQDLVSFLTWVAKASASDRVTTQFQQRLWNENKVSSVGRGSISVDSAI